MAPTPIPGPATWCQPLHNNPEGPTDASKVSLPPNFTVAIAGGSRGIGAGCARAYARAGASNIVIASRNPQTLAQTADELRTIHPKAQVVNKVCDVTSETDVAAFAAVVKETFGHLDVLVINAGTAPKLVKKENGLRDFPFGLVEQNVAEFKSIFELNTLAPFVLMHYFLPLLEATKDGSQSIVLISSAAAHYTDPEVMAPSYSLSKFAATRLVEHCHESHHRNGVCAFALQPGGVKTDLADVPEGKGWEERLIDHVELAGSFSVWLTKEKRDWLSGRYIDSRWDTDELVRRKDEIVDRTLLRFRLAM